jgi:hypothetical protein
MEAFPTRQHRGHDGNPPVGRRGTFKNKTWVSGERSTSSSPFQAGHLGTDAPRWERGGVTRGGGRGRGRGKGRSPRPELDGMEHSPSDEPVLDTLEERERHYQEVSPTSVTTRVDREETGRLARNESSSLRPERQRGRKLSRRARWTIR